MSSSPAPASEGGGPAAPSSTAPTTADRSPVAGTSKQSSPDANSPEVMMLSDDDEEADASSSSEEEDDEEKDADYDAKGKGKAKAKADTAAKRKAKTSASSTPATKKQKTSSTTSKTTSDKSKSASKKKEEQPLVQLKKGKFDMRQKPLTTNLAESYTTEMHAFGNWAVEQLRDENVKELSVYPEEHYGFIAKLVHESSQTLMGLATSVKNTLKTAIAAKLATACEDSQEVEENEWDETKVGEKLPIAPIKALIQSVATRTNYGLSASDLPDASPSSSKEDGDNQEDGDKTDGSPAPEVPAGLQIWCWEVEDDKLWVKEFAPRLEKRKAERQEAQRAALELFQSLPTSEQQALLDGKSSSTSSKGKEKAQGESAAGKTPKAKKKEQTEEEKKAAEEIAAARAAREAEKESKRKERDEKRAAKAEKDAAEQAKKDEKARVKAEKDAAEQAKKDEKARIKAERQAEEDKKVQLAKKQKNMFTSFFVKKSASPAPVEVGPSNSRPAKSSVSDFDRVFHPFTVRERVEVAPVNRFRQPNHSYEIELDSKPDLTLQDSLSSFLSTASKRRIPPYNPYPEPPLSVRQTVNAISDATLTSQDVSALYNALKDPKKTRIKLLKFREDYRPGYVGTWTKRSVMVGPRTPFARDTAILNYEHDSEAEWEEEVDDPDAEDVASDGERSGDEKEEVEGDVDSWLAEDDEIEYQEGYDADGDMVMQAAENGGRLPGEDDDIVVVESEKTKKKKEREAKKRKADRDRKKKREIMLPVAKGMFWQDDVEEVVEPAIRPMRIQLLNDSVFGLNPFTFVSKPFVTPAAGTSAAGGAAVPAGKENLGLKGFLVPSEAAKSSVPTLSAGSVNTLKAKRAPPKKPFPTDQLPALLRMLHGSIKTKPVLINDFFELMKQQSTPIPKVTIEAKIKEIPCAKVKSKTLVAPEFLAQYGIVA